MSPRVDTATTLPRQKRHLSDPLSRMIAEALDHQLHCYAESECTFSIPEVRDQLLKLPELEHVDSNALRFRVRDRVKTLEKLALVKEVGTQGKRRRLFRMTLPMTPDGQTASESAPPPSDITTPTPSDDPTSILDHLEQERGYLQSAMQVAISEAEHYQRLISQFPEARQNITPLLDEALERSGQLQGKWDANLKVRRSISHQVGQASQPVSAEDMS